MLSRVVDVLRDEARAWADARAVAQERQKGPLPRRHGPPSRTKLGPDHPPNPIARATKREIRCATMGHLADHPDLGLVDILCVLRAMDRGGGVDVALQDLQQAWRIFVNSTLVAESARVAKEAAVAAAAALRG